MNNEQKSKQELILEIEALKKKYSTLRKAFLELQNLQNLGASKTILVVDDNKDTRNTIFEMLELYHYKVIAAASSTEAIQLFNTHKDTIDLVLSDVVMPEISGPELVEKLLKINSEVKVVFMSGYAEKDIVHSDVEKVIDSDFDFIEKPFNLTELATVISLKLTENIGRIKNDD